MFPLVSFQESAEVESSLRHIKALLYAFKFSSVFESTVHRKSPHIFVDIHLVLEENNFSHNKSCLVNILSQKNKFSRGNLTITMNTI